MMRKNNNQNRNNMKHRGGQGGGQRRYNNNGGGGGNRGNDSGNIQRQKHHATQMLGKYGDLARNAQINGDRVDVEYYLQHVDHYTRVLTDIAAIEAERFSHQREQQSHHSGNHEGNAQDNQHASGNEGSETSPAETHTNAEAPAENGEQPQVDAAPQQPRQPRPARQRRPQQPDNGAREANANKDDIPLPDSILPPV